MKITLAPLAGAAAIAACVALTPATASARLAFDSAGNPCPSGPKTAPGRVDVAAGYTLAARRAPRVGARKLRSLADGRRVRVLCQTRGERVTGTFGTSRLWDKLAGGGYVSDTYVYTGADGRVAPACPPRTKSEPGKHDAKPQKGKGRPRSVRMRDDYPHPAASPREADRWGFFFRECTSFVAYRLNRLKGFTFTNRMRGGHFGDARHWDDNARALGFRVDRRPTVGSVMVRDSGTWGHVAIVARVTRTRFLDEEYNHEVDHGYGRRWISRSASSPEWDRSIHFRT